MYFKVYFIKYGGAMEQNIFLKFLPIKKKLTPIEIFPLKKFDI